MKRRNFFGNFAALVAAPAALANAVPLTPKPAELSQRAAEASAAVKEQWVYCTGVAPASCNCAYSTVAMVDTKLGEYTKFIEKPAIHTDVDWGLKFQNK